MQKFLRKVDWMLSKYLLQKSIIKRRLNEFEMFLDLKTPGISRTLAIYRTREDDMIEIIKTYLKEGMTILDCGSNIGFYPMLATKLVKENGKVFSIEPDPRNYKILLKNIQISSFPKIIEPYNMALSNHSGKQTMIIANESNLNKLKSNNDDQFKNRHLINGEVSVKTMTVDDFCSKKNTKIDFIRMDIEGFEIEVFEGMEKTLESASSGFMILLELHPHLYSTEKSFSDVLKKVFNLGFKSEVIVSAGEAQPKKFKELGYSPTKKIKSDGYIRGWYENVKAEDAILLTCFEPKMSRYILLKKS